MKKKWLAGFVSVLLVLALGIAGCATDGGTRAALFARPGTYVVQAPGWIGVPMITTVTVDRNRILSITVNHSESHGFGTVAIDTIVGEILAHQTINVDVVVGATLTSVPLINSIGEALIDKAGGNPARLTRRPPGLEFRDTAVDVVVVGSGVAGFTAAIQLARNGKDVILLEKEGILGGTSVRAGAGPGGSGSQAQIASGFLLDRLAVDGGGRITTAREDVRAHAGTGALTGEFRDFFRLMAANSKYLIDFSNEVRPTNTVFSVGSHNVSTSHRSVTPAQNLGVWAYGIEGLKATALRHGVDIRLNNRGVYLLNPNGAIAGTADAIGGIRVQTSAGTYDIRANAVVLATGGFGGNQELKKEFFVNAEYCVNTTRYNTMYYATGPASMRHSMGDGHIMARRVGAALDMMHAITTRSLGMPGEDISHIVNAQMPHADNWLSGAMPRGRGAIAIDPVTGRRFGNELNEPTSNCGFFNADGTARYLYLVLPHTPVVRHYILGSFAAAGLLRRANTPEEAADIMRLTGPARAAFIDEIAQVRHIAAHNTGVHVGQANAITAARACNNPNCPHHGVAIRADFPPHSAGGITEFFWASGPLYVTRMAPVLHGTYGGIRTNINAQAIRGQDRHQQPANMAEAALGSVIPGLYAVGTCARPPRGSAPNLQSAGAWGIAAANHILGRPSFDSSYWD